MHLRSYPKFLCSEVHLDAVRVQTSSQRSAYFGSQQETLMMKMSSNQSNISTSRIPLSFISTNTLCYSTGGPSLHLKAPRSTTGQQLSCRTDSRCSTPLGPCRSTTEDADVAPNVWTVIKPGHVREKIAIFASEATRTDGADGGDCSSALCLSHGDPAAKACTNSNTPLGPLRAVKAKGSWEENRSAKRRRRCLSNQNHQLDQRSHILTEPEPRCSEGPGGQCGEAPEPAQGPTPAEEEQKISVVEMVAFLEQRASELQPNLKPLLSLQRSSTTITLSRNPRPEIKEGDEPDIIRVSEMVAKLESKCLRSSETSLSRSNSLKRTVGRVLLAAGQKSYSSCWTQPQPQPSSGPPETLTADRVEPPVHVVPTVRVESPAWVLPPTPAAPPKEVSGETAGLQSSEQEPLPGLLFLSADETGPTLCTPHYRTTFYLEPALPPVSAPQRSEKNKAHKTMGCPPCSAAVPLGRSASVSQDFLRVRQRLQQLLAPQSYLLLLPHHLLVNLLLLLPTQSLAALKCTCSYLKFVIENYSVRPADSLWVSDPRYRDDPCKQCKKRYRPGDVSLCRWHHKPYCQALPYGPGYWMCCHSAQRDALGCNVGLHDNRWVPAFHSINVPIYRRNYHYES
ncbi:F-box only protein 34 [Xiphophorus couchianus]|uniref:F-box only protein 34 n=1 Tax=Xiphophorus couchianus TaxID=32473 RepID=UPI001016B6EB|nr:F-box only protein 34-like [Xiphophorus couchianus]XP_027892282.1 F-box only protein 34-like [Xiphophorus couchianus]XP_027892283.1 F-box only protein 34-like [Xiphophorus couchianus]